MAKKIGLGPSWFQAYRQIKNNYKKLSAIALGYDIIC